MLTEQYRLDMDLPDVSRHRTISYEQLLFVLQAVLRRAKAQYIIGYRCHIAGVLPIA